jgi:carboxylesterase type B
MSTFCLYLVISIQFLFYNGLKSQDGLLVKTLNGYVNGMSYSVKIENENVVLDAWYGIPFAQPPIDNLRFKRPSPIGTWQEVLDATSKKKPCFQSATVGAEDCLYLNIVRPANTTMGKLLPVLVSLRTLIISQIRK